MPGLPELLTREKALRHLSYTQMATLTGIPRATLAWMCNQTDHFYTGRENVQAIASGLGLPLREVQVAAIETAGLMPESLRVDSVRTQSLASVVDDLSDEDYGTVLALARRLAGVADG